MKEVTREREGKGESKEVRKKEGGRKEREKEEKERGRRKRRGRRQGGKVGQSKQGREELQGCSGLQPELAAVSCLEFLLSSPSPSEIGIFIEVASSH